MENGSTEKKTCLSGLPYTKFPTTITQYVLSSPAVVGSTVPVAVLAVPVRVLAVHWVWSPWRLWAPDTVLVISLNMGESLQIREERGEEVISLELLDGQPLESAEPRYCMRPNVVSGLYQLREWETGFFSLSIYSHCLVKMGLKITLLKPPWRPPAGLETCYQRGRRK